MDTTPGFPTLRIVSHPLVQHKLSILRDRETPTKIFKELVDEIAMLHGVRGDERSRARGRDGRDAARANRRQAHERKEADARADSCAPASAWSKGSIVSCPGARIGHIGLYRDHDTLEPVDYYFKVPGDAPERDFFLLDPMLATGGSAVAAVSSLKRAGATRIRFMCLVAAPEGVRRLAQRASGRGRVLRVARPRAQRAGLHPARTWRRRRPTLRNALRKRAETAEARPAVSGALV